MLMVENLIEVVTMHDRGYHEDIADQLLREFGGKQTLTANHHGVDIKTVRIAESMNHRERSDKTRGE